MAVERSCFKKQKKYSIYLAVNSVFLESFAIFFQEDWYNSDWMEIIVEFFRVKVMAECHDLSAVIFFQNIFLFQR